MLYAGWVRAMLTPEMRERAVKLMADAQAMGAKPQRYDYQIGDYWNICGEVVEFLEDLLGVREDCAAPMAAASVNPLFEAEKET